MCGIIVSEKEHEALLKGLEITKHRGPDATEIVKHVGGVFMFNRLSIMGLSDDGMQPFIFEGNILKVIVTVKSYYHYIKYWDWVCLNY